QPPGFPSPVQNLSLEVGNASSPNVVPTLYDRGSQSAAGREAGVSTTGTWPSAVEARACKESNSWGCKGVGDMAKVSPGRPGWPGSGGEEESSLGLSENFSPAGKMVGGKGG
ncbi:unnamed protein product, partial [Discosporangium mesarthrocarpum]